MESSSVLGNGESVGVCFGRNVGRYISVGPYSFLKGIVSPGAILTYMMK
jgi:hypothetical protein